MQPIYLIPEMKHSIKPYYNFTAAYLPYKLYQLTANSLHPCFTCSKITAPLYLPERKITAPYFAARQFNEKTTFGNEKPDSAKKIGE
jgi:hypothetical protein